MTFHNYQDTSQMAAAGTEAHRTIVPSLSISSPSESLINSLLSLSPWM